MIKDINTGQPWLFSEIPILASEALSENVLTATKIDGGRLIGVWAWPAGKETSNICAVVAFDKTGRLGIARITVKNGESFPALTPLLPAAQAFEREIFESVGLQPIGHPWLKPLIKHSDLTAERIDHAKGHHFFQVDGPGIHEVAVGPVHAGVIEPGHFRFQCVGETVLHLEIQLGYQHRGVESLLVAATPTCRLAIVESTAGDTVIGHTSAYCDAMEALAGVEIPLRAQAIRAIALELERIASHIGDLGALCGDIGYLPGAAYCGRLRGEALNLLLALSGNRFGRGLLMLGGVRYDLDARLRQLFAQQLETLQRDIDMVADLIFSEPSVLARFEQTGILPLKFVEALGIVGPVARASGCRRDVRTSHPSGLFRFAHIPIAQLENGDVLARSLIRHVEIRRSIIFVREEIEHLPQGALMTPVGRLANEAIAVRLIEGWRGEIAHVAITDTTGNLSAYRIVDPSLHNWYGLTIAMRNQQISDFPLCNKSFNLSYAGHDR